MKYFNLHLEESHFSLEKSRIRSEKPKEVTKIFQAIWISFNKSWTSLNESETSLKCVWNSSKNGSASLKEILKDFKKSRTNLEVL